MKRLNSTWYAQPSIRSRTLGALIAIGVLVLPGCKVADEQDAVTWQIEGHKVECVGLSYQLCMLTRKGGGEEERFLSMTKIIDGFPRNSDHFI